MTEKELKDCPCCGSSDVGGSNGIVECCVCHLKVQKPTTEQAMECWNTRVDGWVSVDDRLPEFGQRVLITDGENIGHARTQERLDGYSWLIVSSNHHESKENVTHWMPLPTPPEGE